MQRYFALQYDDKIILRDSDIHHIRNVMRMKINDRIEVVFDKKLYICNIDCIEPLSLSIVDTILEDNRINLDVTIALGLVKEKKMDMILQKLTELGVNEIIPVNMERSIVRLDDDRISKKMVRWNMICKEASEQSKRSCVPIIRDVIDFKDLVKIDGDVKMVASVKERDKLLNFYLQDVDNCAKIVVVIGPEGGISDREESYLIDNGYSPVSFGNLVFRVETACIYVASVMNYCSNRGV